MRSPERGRWILIAGALALGVGCAHHSAPKGFLATPSDAGKSARGGWLDVEVTADAGQRSQLSGELLAVSPESLWVQPVDAPGVVVARRALGDKGRLTMYAATTDAVTGWTVLGAVTTISNGAILIITAPLWAISGGIAGASDTRAAQTPVAREGLDADMTLRAFARYPQGMPRGADTQFSRLPRRGAP